MSTAEEITMKLRQGLNPARLAVVDESRRHEGHQGARPEGESHFFVEVVSEAFAGLSRLERHRLVHDLLREQLEGHVHALSLRMLTPAEAEGSNNPSSPF